MLMSHGSSLAAMAPAAGAERSPGCHSIDERALTLLSNSLWAVTVGCPRVTVPVLSNTIVRILYARSSASPPLIRIPLAAPTPVPTMTAVGVARPSAQGQAMTSTAMPNRRANRKWLWPSGSQLAGYHPALPATYLQANNGVSQQ